ncbi:sigma-70 family RNA polymerase sigma factor [Arenibacter sp. N53]|jgi:RNA polymerase sigma-70 factor (ECF subfamily)|uniref:RNA polymerase sigma factor n=1 Tax=Arenibacter TaxID=178469 RepID=UPI000CD4374E|nr:MULTISPECIES: sigma-70 family RNA polymerase sigma factor [Arenibacter]MCM4152591.1 sigma-70 family RNA polymerase sigma factor [Arenibacter sp. N53]|tara:strand:+ start:1414 stop:1920 length:507 start_codon:yes stop_codon:yes gene_type:complete
MGKEIENTFLDALEQNQQKLLRICSVYAKDAEDTKDLFQEVLIHIWQSMPNFKSNSLLSTWIFRIALNVCLRFRSKDIKKQKRFLYLDGIAITNLASEKETNEQNEQLAQLRNCIKELNEVDKAVITLYLEELPYKEISGILGLTENTVAVKVKRIKKKLLNCINQAS